MWEFLDERVGAYSHTGSRFVNFQRWDHLQLSNNNYK